MGLRIVLAGIMLLLANLTQAIPVSSNALDTPTGGNMTFFASGYEVYCDINGYTYINEGSGGSPTNEDCKQITYNIAKDGHWTWIEDAQHQLVQYKTCAFGVEPGKSKSGDILLTGNGDIITIINEAVKRFGSGGKTGASGYMWCDKKTNIHDGNWAKVKWGIYHN